MLFDPGLQFRPTSGRRKRDAADKYWKAIQRELETGCTCTAFDLHGSTIPCSCGAQKEDAGSGHLPSRSAIKGTLRNVSATSRIPALVTELRETLLSVMIPSPVPLSDSVNLDMRNVIGTPGGLLVTPSSALCKLIVKHVANPLTATELSMEGPVPDQPPKKPSSPDLFPPLPSLFPVLYPKLSPQISHYHAQIRAVLDVPLILQQVRYGVFDPVQLISFLGGMLKLHCAPIRDELVDDVVGLAEESRRTDENGKPDLGKAVLAIRRCFDILELMRLVRKFQFALIQKNGIYVSVGYCEPSTALASSLLDENSGTG